MVDAELVRRRLSYDPETGIFHWKVGPRRGMEAGNRRASGYVIIGMCGYLIMAHRLAWLYVHGVWPEHQIDHKDGLSNAIANLRAASHGQNCQNTRSTNRNGFKGVSRVTGSPKWRARIGSGSKGTSQYLGCFDTPEAAHEAYCAAAKRLYGEFARFA